MRAIIAEDEHHLAEDLRTRLNRLWPELAIIATVHDGDAAASALRELKPDIAFLDIRMPGSSGMEAASAALPDCRIVFVTAYDDYAVQAFDRAAADYLLKPVSDARLQQAIARLQQPAMQPSDALLKQLRQLLHDSDAPERLRWLKVQLGESIQMVAVEEVCFFRSEHKYTTACTRDAEHLLRLPLKSLVDQLDPDLFWQVHRGTVVNVRQILSADRGLDGRLKLTLRDRNETLTVSRSFTHLFRQM